MRRGHVRENYFVPIPNGFVELHSGSEYNGLRLYNMKYSRYYNNDRHEARGSA
jgi:hypothetical protein